MNHSFPKLLMTKAAIGLAMLPSLSLLAEAQAAPTTGQPVAIDQQKLVVAKHLTHWLQQTLLERKAIVAVVARKGGKDLKGRDRTGMAHSGLAVYDPRAQTWILYQILKSSASTEPVAELWRMAPLDFFYGQTGYEENALVLIPEAETQQRIYDSILSGRAWRLAFTRKYNLLSKYDGHESLNCNKWVLMTIAAARTDNYDTDQVLTTIHNGFKPGRLRMNFIEKHVVKCKPNVRKDELPLAGAIETVTPQSLYESDLFEERIFATPVPGM